MKAEDLFENFNERDIRSFLKKLHWLNRTLFPADVLRFAKEYYKNTPVGDSKAILFTSSFREHKSNLLNVYYEYDDDYEYLDLITYIIEHSK